MSARRTLAAIILLAAMAVAVRAEPVDCATMPLSVHGVEDVACSILTRFDFDAFHVNQHYKEFSVPPSVVPGLDARGVIYELRGQGSAGGMIYAALARADNGTHIRFMDDLEAWAASGWLPWRRGEDSDWSATGTVRTAAGKWYYARFSLGDRRCLVVQRYQTLHENGFRYAVMAATCRAGATYGAAGAARLADSLLVTLPLN